jgi:hypothetical protein
MKIRIPAFAGMTQCETSHFSFSPAFAVSLTIPNLTHKVNVTVLLTTLYNECKEEYHEQRCPTSERHRV